MHSESCPAHNKLQQFASGDLDLNEIDTVESHVESCKECQAKLTLLDEDQDKLFGLIQKIPTRSNYLEEAELQIAIKDIEVLDKRSGDKKEKQISIESPCIHINDFRVIREIGRGGMGIVYEAEQISLNRKVAIKVLPFSFASGNRRKRFEIESQAVAMLQHDNIISIHSTGEAKGSPYYVMPFIEGVNLQQLMVLLHLPADQVLNTIGDYLDETPGLAQECIETVEFVKNLQEQKNQVSTNTQQNIPELSETKFSQGNFQFNSRSDYFQTMAELGVQAANALQHAHEMGIIHRDIKPSNLLINQAGHLWVTDFGLAKIESHDGATFTGDVMGTIRYMSPEQALGKQDLISNRTDVYSLGVTLYELVTLSPFFPGDSKEKILYNIVNDEPVPPGKINSKIPKDLETIILKATDKKIENRYPSAKYLKDDLERFLTNRPILAKRPTVLDKVIKWCTRYKIATISIISGLFLLTLVSFVFMIIFSTQNKKLVEADKEIISALEQAKEQNYAMSTRLASEALKEDDIIRAKELISNFDPKEGQTDLRGMEWFLLKNETEQFHEEYKLSEKALYTICKSANKGIVAVAGEESKIILLDLKSLNVVREIQTDQGEINGMDLTNAGETLATAGDDGNVKLWNTSTGKLKKTIRIFPDKTKKGKPIRAYGVHFTPSEKGIICTGNTEEVRLINLTSPNEAMLFTGHSRDVTDVAISRDEKFLYTGSMDRTIHMWDFKTGKSLKNFRIPKRATNWAHVTSLDLSKDDKKLAIGVKNHSVHIWDLENDNLLLVGSHKDPVQSVCFSSDQTSIISSDRSGSIKTWPVNNQIDIGIPQSLIPDHSQLLHDGRVYGVVPGIKNELLSVGDDGYLRKSRAESTRLNGLFKNNINKNILNAIRYSPDAGVFCYLTTEAVHIYKEKEGGEFEEYWDIPIKEANEINLQQIGKLLVSGGNNGEIHIWNLEKKELLYHWKIPDYGKIEQIVISHNMKSLALLNDSKATFYRVEEINSSNSSPKFTRTHEINANKLEMLPLQNRLMFFFENSVSVWDFDKQAVLNQFNELTGGVDDYYLTPDQKTFIISDKNRSIHFWDYLNGKIARKPWKHHSSITAIEMSPDQQTLITADRKSELTFWHIKTGQPIHSMKHRLCEQVLFLNSGKLLTSAKVSDVAFEIIDFGPFWNEHYRKNSLN